MACKYLWTESPKVIAFLAKEYQEACSCVNDDGAYPIFCRPMELASHERILLRSLTVLLDIAPQSTIVCNSEQGPEQQDLLLKVFDNGFSGAIVQTVIARYPNDTESMTFSGRAMFDLDGTRSDVLELLPTLPLLREISMDLRLLFNDATACELLQCLGKCKALESLSLESIFGIDFSDKRRR
jgi:hypothetical protein